MIIYQKISDYLKKHRQNLILRRFLMGAASVVVFVTTYLLILPAITVEIQSEFGAQTVSASDVSSGDLLAELETQSEWEQITGNVTLSGIWAEDLVAIAKSQLGYQESTINFITNENGEMRGYTRYGEWYGQPHKEWSTLFVAFCLHYAQVSEEVIPREADCQAWIEALAEESCSRYQTVAEYTPVAGDLVFLDLDSDKVAERVGIIEEVVESEGDNATQFKVIEGDFNNSVQCNTYSTQDETVIGYGQMYEQEEVLEEPTVINYEKRYSDGKVAITAYYTDAAQIPEEAELIAYQVTEETAPERYEQRQQEAQEILQGEPVEEAAETEEAEEGKEFLIYNIGFYLDGQELEPKDTVTVTLQFLSEDGFAVGESITVIHFADSGTETLNGTDVAQDEDGELSTTFEAASFSDFAIVADTPTPYAATNQVVNVSREGTSSSGLRYYLESTSFNGTIKLTADFSVSRKYDLNRGRNVTIDLNGHRLTSSATFINIYGGTLEIIDSSTASVSSSVVSGSVYGNEASYNNGGLTYYVTETAVTESSTGATQETLRRYQVSNIGSIRCTNTNEAAFFLQTGTLNINGGMIAGCTNRAVDMRGGTLNLNGGYVCGNTANSGSDSGYGGAVIAKNENGTPVINLSGTVLAANEAVMGGAIHITDGTLNITGGIISGNKADTRGGGVRANNATVTMTGTGYVTNNIAGELGTVYDDGNEYYNGGGGFLLTGNSVMTLNSGYVTGNLTKSGGGGIFAENSAAVKFHMNGGHVAANYAQNCEGGGVRVNAGCVGIFSGGYITNNRTNTQEHWGGGGLFVGEGGTSYLTTILVTNNRASGFGGGVAGCSTAQIYLCGDEVATKGFAIYGNSAAGTNLSGGESSKHEDHTYATQNPIFMNNAGYQDFFCMLYSYVVDRMLGGGSENWRGSIDGASIMIAQGEEVTSNSVAGLTANPTAEDKVAAQAAAKLYVNGNSSNTHGGGILNNGYMALGAVSDSTVIDFTTRMELYGTKDLITDEGLELTNGQFSFTITDEQGNVVAKGINDADGNISFDRRLVFNQQKTYTFYLQEDATTNPTFTTDYTKYRITVNVVKRENGTIEDSGNIIKKNVYHIESVSIDKQTGGSSDWIPVELGNVDTSKEENSAIKINVTSGATFTNYKLDKMNVAIEKKWVGLPQDSVTVDLYQNGSVYDTQVLQGKASAPQWTSVYSGTNPTGHSAGITNEITLDSPVYSRYIRIYGFTRATQYGFSIYEVKVFEQEGGDNLALNQSVEVSSVEVSSDTAQLQGGNAVDGDSSTRWASLEGVDNQYITVDLGETKKITSVILEWETAYARTYEIQILKGDENWGYTWQDLPVVDENGSTYVYEVKERPVDGYFANYDITGTGSHSSYWIPAQSLDVGNKYMLVSQDSTQALMISEEHSQGHFSQTDKINISSAKGSGRIDVGGVQYNDWYDASLITDSKAFFTAQSYDGGVALRNDGNADSWLSVRDDGGYGKYLSAVSSQATIKPSTFVYTRGYLRGLNYADGLQYTITYGYNSNIGGDAFNASSSSTANAVKLYQLVHAAAEGTSMVTITNTSAEEAEFTLELTKVSGRYPDRMLRNAEFEIRDSGGNMLYYSKNNGTYQVCTAETEGAVTTLVSDKSGKIVVTGIRAGNYILHESKAPAGYYVVEDQSFTMDKNTPDAKLELTIADPAIEYELPKTGGVGTFWYTMAGLTLFGGGAYLLYKRDTQKGGKSP